MSYITAILIIILMTCTIWLVHKAAVAASDPKNPFTQLEFAVSAMALLGSAIAISYFAVVYVVLV